jgi:hypothetical protein
LIENLSKLSFSNETVEHLSDYETGWALVSILAVLLETLDDVGFDQCLLVDGNF